jgi:hypothetical protein
VNAVLVALQIPSAECCKLILDYLQKRALEETKTVIPGLREKVVSAREKLESALDTAENEEEKQKALDVLIKAKEAQKDYPVG